MTTIKKEKGSASALDIVSDERGGDWAIRIIDQNGWPRGQFNSAGAYYTNSWVVISGVACEGMLKGEQCTPENWRPVVASPDPHMLSVWADTPHGIISRAANIHEPESLKSTLFRGINWKGQDVFAVRPNGAVECQSIRVGNTLLTEEQLKRLITLLENE